MKQVHGVRISHQTVINYANGVSALVKDMVDHYPYKIGSVLSGDETYIKVRGKNQYVFFWSILVRRSSHHIPSILHVIQNAPADQSMTV